MHTCLYFIGIQWCFCLYLPMLVLSYALSIPTDVYCVFQGQYLETGLVFSPSNMAWVRFSIINWECRLFRFLSSMVVRNICGSIFLQSSPSHSFSTNIMGGHYIDFSSFSSNRKMNAASFGREKKCCFLAGKMKNNASLGILKQLAVLCWLS